MKYTSLPIFLDKPSLVVINEWKITPGFSVVENSGEIVITTTKLKVVVDKLRIPCKYYTDLDGNIILSEDGS